MKGKEFRSEEWIESLSRALLTLTATHGAHQEIHRYKQSQCPVPDQLYRNLDHLYFMAMASRHILAS